MQLLSSRNLGSLFCLPQETSRAFGKKDCHLSIEAIKFWQLLTDTVASKLSCVDRKLLNDLRCLRARVCYLQINSTANLMINLWTIWSSVMRSKTFNDIYLFVHFPIHFNIMKI